MLREKARERRSAFLPKFKNRHERVSWPAKSYSYQNIQSSRRTTTVQTPNGGLRGGHRGEPVPQWGGGPREPPVSRLGVNNNGNFTIFIDGLSTAVTNMDLKALFQKSGRVVDAFVSRKQRSNKRWAFGFIRFNNGEEARRAISNINGQQFFGRKISVSWARFNREGRTFATVQNIEKKHGQKVVQKQRLITSPAYRDD